MDKACRTAKPAERGSVEPAALDFSCRDCGVYRLCAPLGLESADMALLERIVRRKNIYRRGEFLFHAGQAFDFVYALRSGSVKSFVSTDDGRIQITGLHVAGELLGLGAMGPQSYTCSAVALEPTSACRIAVDRLEDVAAQVPGIHREMVSIMSEQIVRDEELMLLLGKRSAEERLAAFLMGLSNRFAQRHLSPTRFQVSMSRSDIGNYLGLAEETVCRLLARFQEQGLVSVHRRLIELNDRERLHQLASGHGKA